MNKRVYGRFGKRILDIIVSVLLLSILAPLIIVAAIAIRWRLGSPIFFRQARAGLAGRPFELVKFRTMTEERNADGELLPDVERLTAFGQFIRKYSLDELPQLWNVVRGEMSLVGPRPLLLSYVGRYSDRQSRRLEVVPGITGWAQINGRNAVSWNEKFELDIWYVDRQCFALDAKILSLTLTHLLFPRHISADRHATMPEFMGTTKGGTMETQRR
jgi:sugar transferase EpsL